MYKNFYDKLKNKQGMTLIEILIVLAMFTVIMGVGYSFYLLGIKSFALGENRSNVQYEVRKAAYFISSQSRLAKEIIISDMPSEYREGKQYVYVKNGLVIFYDGSHETVVAGVSDQVTFEPLVFKAPKKGFLNIEIKAQGGKEKNQQNFSITTEVKLLNVLDFYSSNTGAALELTTSGDGS